MVATPSSSACIKLINEDLWKEFNNFVTEMIVTKTGRKLFPKIEISVEGLEPNEQYVILLQMDRVGNSRFKFANGEWISAGSADPNTASRPSSHHDGPQLGKTWMRGPICFDHVKLTNCPTDGGQKIQLHSMHKYRPKLLVYRIAKPSPFAGFSFPHSDMTLVTSFSSTIMDFIAVTAYQNQQIIKLKIKYNPFAKGFREGNERKRCSDSSGSSSPSPSCVKKPKNEPFGHSMTIDKLNSPLTLPPHQTVFSSFNLYGFPRPTWPYPVWNFSSIMPQVNPYVLNPALASHAFNSTVNSYRL